MFRLAKDARTVKREREKKFFFRCNLEENKTGQIFEMK